MTESDIKPISRDEVELLLPWYLNGTLEATDHSRVGAYLKGSSEFDNQLAALREDMAETVAVNEGIRGPSRDALDRIMAQVEREPRPLHGAHTANGAISRIVDTIERFLQSLSPGRLGFAAMAAAAVIFVQAGLLGSTWLSTGEQYTTASGETEEVSGTAFLVQFKSQANLKKVTSFLETHRAKIVAGPNEGGFFKIRIEGEPLPTKARLTLLKEFEAKTSVVEMVLPSD